MGLFSIFLILPPPRVPGNLKLKNVALFVGQRNQIGVGKTDRRAIAEMKRLNGFSLAATFEGIPRRQSCLSRR
jgi:hypothetical protein